MKIFEFLNPVDGFNKGYIQGKIDAEKGNKRNPSLFCDQLPYNFNDL